MRKLTNIFLLLSLSMSLCAQTPSEASKTLEQLVSRLEQETFIGSFHATITQDPTQQAMPLNGMLEMQREVFHANIWTMEVSYDGVTLATYDEDNNELTLSYPTPAEIEHINPLMVVRHFARTAKVGWSRLQPKGFVSLDLTTDDDPEVEKITLQLRSADLLPEIITIKQRNGAGATIVFKQQQWSRIAPVTNIPTNHEGKPQPYINDLR